MPMVVKRLERPKKKKKPDDVIVHVESSADTLKKRLRLIHGESGMLFAGKTLKGEHDGAILMNTCGVKLTPGDELFALDEGWTPYKSRKNPGERYKKYGWCVETTDFRAEEALTLGPIKIDPGLYKKLDAYVEKYSATEWGCQMNRCGEEVPVPPFILDLYLEKNHTAYYKVDDRIYKRDFDYRKILSPFSRNILHTVEEKHYVHLKDFSRIKNAQEILSILADLELLNIYGDMYILSREKAYEIPAKIRVHANQTQEHP